jgi:hypothetical protein
MNHSRHRYILGILFASWATISMASTVPDEAWQDKIHPILAKHSGDDPVEFLVMLKSRADLSQARGFTTK